MEQNYLITLSKNELLEKCKNLNILKCRSKNKSELININQENKLILSINITEATDCVLIINIIINLLIYFVV